ncbi:MAG TPA: glycosyltransferase family A protein [Pirellulales bacterium]|nr:glycosyltransferase family A protein [Pirellulales bacterium]
MNAGRIAAIIPFFNRQQSLLATLRCVESQTHLPSQLVLVDDGSTDRGAEVVTDWIEQLHGRFDCRLLRKPNGGAASARNHGLSQAQPSEYVAFLDSDDHWPADFLARTQAALAAHPTAVAATCDRRFVFADGRKNKLESCSPIAQAPSLWLLERGAGIASCTLFRRSEVERQGGFDLTLPTGQDAALYLPLTLRGPWLYVAGEAVDFSRGVAQHAGDEGNLSQKYADSHLAWAQIYEEFFVRRGGQAWLSHPRCRRTLARRWFQAGRQLLRLGAHHKALASFRKSRAWNPWKARYYAGLFRAWFAMRSRSSTDSYAASQATATLR